MSNLTLTSCSIFRCNWSGNVTLLPEHVERCHNHQYKKITSGRTATFKFADIYEDQAFLLDGEDRCYWLQFQTFEDAVDIAIHKIGSTRHGADEYYVKFGCFHESGLTDFFGPYRTKQQFTGGFETDLSYDAVKKYEMKSPTIMVYFTKMSESASTSNNEDETDQEYSDGSYNE